MDIMPVFIQHHHHSHSREGTGRLDSKLLRLASVFLVGILVNREEVYEGSDVSDISDISDVSGSSGKLS